MKTALRLCLSLSVLCLVGGAAGLLAGRGRSVEPLPLQFDPDPFVIPADLKSHNESDITIEVLNASSEPARIVGVREFCSSACFYGRGLPVTIPARGRGRLTIHLKANDPGPISEEVEFFTDRPSQPTLTLRIQGNIGKGALDDEAPITSFKP